MASMHSRPGATVISRQEAVINQASGARGFESRPGDLLWGICFVFRCVFVIYFRGFFPICDSSCILVTFFQMLEMVLDGRYTAVH